ncbi:MAG TPA: hypothetical protein PLF35_07715 [Prolixibacteraceae bacterium]|nr:hypothetical protein [Prolixibacteraceae bacterium]
MREKKKTTKGIQNRLGIFPEWFLWLGTAFLAIGVLATYLYFYGGKPDFFETKIFAVYTSYIKTRYFVWAQTNLLDEIGGVFSLIGLFFMGFARVKTETAQINAMRIKSLLQAVVITVFAWILVFAFVYGWPIFIASTFVFYLFLLLNFVIFRVKYLLYKNH